MFSSYPTGCAGFMEEFLVQVGPLQSCCKDEAALGCAIPLQKEIAPSLEQVPLGKGVYRHSVKTHPWINPRNCCSVGRSVSCARRRRGEKKPKPTNNPKMGHTEETLQSSPFSPKHSPTAAVAPGEAGAAAKPCSTNPTTTAL